LENSSLSLNLVLDTDVILVVHYLALAALPHAIMRLHLHVKLRVAVHHAALLNEALEWTDFHSQTEGFIGKIGKTVASNLSLGRDDLFLSFFRFQFFVISNKGEGVQ
jgi:hypothetical protein